MLNRIADAAVRAGAAILPYFCAISTKVTTKGDGSPVTLADVAAERVIDEDLRIIAPRIPVVAEEAASGGRIPATKDCFFLVDPLDGTREFVSGSGEFTVNIALIEDGRPVLGVVYAPALGRIWAGSREDGARMASVTGSEISAWTPIRVSGGRSEVLRIVASRSHLSSETRAFIEQFGANDFVAAGSSLKFCTVAAGEADFYPRLSRTMEWDTAAGDAVLTAAGGKVMTMDGLLLRYGKRDQAGESDFANPWFVATGGFDPFASMPSPRSLS